MTFLKVLNMKNILSNFINKINKIIKSENIQYIVKNILFVFLSVIIVIMYTLYKNITYEVVSASKTLNILNNEYEGYVDKDIFCRSVDCSYVGNINSDKLLNITNISYVSVSDGTYSLHNFYYIHGLYYRLKYTNDYYFLNISNNIKSVLFPSVIILLIFLITIFSLLYKILNEKTIDNIDILKNSEYINKYETLRGLTSNINHELTTPLNVINSLFSDFKYINKDYSNYFEMFNLECDICNKKHDIKCDVTGVHKLLTENLEMAKENVELGELAVSQIYGELSIMNDYKNVMTNTNESIYDLLSLAIKMLNKISVIDILDFTIDDKFRGLIIDPVINMSNMLFVSIVINHLKNSIEANANKIELINDGECIHIKDNGNGVPKKIIKRIFDNDFSTKDTKDILRGNGLFVNKLLLKNKYNGDILLVESIPNIRTLFCLKINMIRKKDD